MAAAAATATKLLANKTVLITGGSKGIGAATSLLLAKNGANVAINYSSDSAAANAIVSQIGQDKAVAIKGDAGSLSDIEQIVKGTVERFGKIDVLIPCAGVLPMKDIEGTSEEDFDRTYRLNVKGPYFLVQKALPHLTPSAHILLVSTSLTTASTVTPPYLLYNSTKGAIEQMTRVLAKDLGRPIKGGITVNCIAPGPTATELFLKGKPEAMINGIASLNPFGKLGSPEEVAEAFLWLSGEGSRWVSGQVVRVNGGFAL